MLNKRCISYTNCNIKMWKNEREKFVNLYAGGLEKKSNKFDVTVGVKKNSIKFVRLVWMLRGGSRFFHSGLIKGKLDKIMRMTVGVGKYKSKVFIETDNSGAIEIKQKD